MRSFALAFALLLVTTVPAGAQVGNLIWSEDFNSLSNWLTLTGNGSWGWGNGELEYYQGSNVSIADVPGEPGNKALRIVARAESGAGIVDQWGNPLSYTSGRLSTRSFVSVKYGMIETRVMVPDLRVGGWPAVWLMGTATAPWPTCGELDMMEMGGRQSFRDQHDSHNGGDGLHDSNVNEMVGANVIYDAATGPGNGSGTVSIASDPADTLDRPYYDYANPLAGRFVVYRMYWDSLSIRYTIVDNGVEHDLYAHPFATAAAGQTFRKPFYLLVNLALGGAFTDVMQLGNPASGAPLSMPLPATMYVDYVHVYQWNGQGDVEYGPPAQEAGRVGLYTDTTPTNESLVPGVDEDIYVWANTLVNGSIAPYEGANVLSWKTNAQGWFGAGIMSRQPVNLFGLGDGSLKFRIKIPSNVTFQIGIIDVWGNQNYVSFPANQTTYGLVRDGNWGQASIPVSAIRGTAMDLRMLSYEFVILETNGTACEFALDDIYWESASLAGVAEPRAHASGVLPSAPNPFANTTDLRFRLAAPAPYALGVYDGAGRRVALLRGVGAAGSNAVRWDATDDAGHRVRPGVYFVRLESSASTASRRVVVLE